MESAGGPLRRDEAVQDHQPLIVRPVLFRLAIDRVHARRGREHRAQQVGLVRINSHRQTGLRRQFQLGMIVGGKAVVRRQGDAQDARGARAVFEAGLLVRARRKRQLLRARGARGPPCRAGRNRARASPCAAACRSCAPRRRSPRGPDRWPSGASRSCAGPRSRSNRRPAARADSCGGAGAAGSRSAVRPGAHEHDLAGAPPACA